MPQKSSDLQSAVKRRQTSTLTAGGLPALRSVRLPTSTVCIGSGNHRRGTHAPIKAYGMWLSRRPCIWLVHPAYLGLLQAQSQLAAARLHSKQGAEAVQAVRHRVQQEWQQLKRLRQRYMQPALQVCAGASSCNTRRLAAPARHCKCAFAMLQVNSQQQPFTLKSILRQASGPLKSPQQAIA